MCREYIFVIGQVRTHAETTGDFPILKQIRSTQPDNTIQGIIITELNGAAAPVVGLITGYQYIIIKSTDQVVGEKLRRTILIHFRLFQHRFLCQFYRIHHIPDFTGAVRFFFFKTGIEKVLLFLIQRIGLCGNDRFFPQRFLFFFNHFSHILGRTGIDIAATQRVLIHF